MSQRKQSQVQVGAVSAAKNPWWRQHEVRRLLETVRKILPLGELQWQEVSSAYNTGRPEGYVERNTDSCKTKFKALKNAKKSSGIAEIPWDIAESKDIQKAIENKMCAAELDDDASLREGDGDVIDQEQEGNDGESESESEQDTGDSQHFSPRAQAGSAVTAKRPSASNSASPHEKPPSDVPARLGIIEAQKGVVASTATAKRLKLEKQIADNQHQRNAQAEHRNALLASMLQQQHQSNQLLMQQMQSQSQQSQQMQMMLMMMMSKMTGVQMPAMPAFAPPSHAPHNERE